MLLEAINTPADLKKLSAEQLPLLAEEVRQFLLETVSCTGGHLGSNLGMVEITIALHRVFSSPTDSLIFDTGHQAYTHKLLTGRQKEFHTLRQMGGLSGYPSRAESEHDLVENSHASTGLSYAMGMATARKLAGQPGHTVCVVGDGSLTGGMAFESLNNIGAARPNLVIVLNDNGRSYAPTVGGIARNLGQLRLSPAYAAAKEAASTSLRNIPLVGSQAYGTARRVKESLKQLVSPTSIFETLGLKYGGPIDGHDIASLERALRDAARIGGPVVVHVVTDKGHGYGPAIEDEIDKFHGVGAFDRESGRSVPKPASWTDLFGTMLEDLAEHDSRIVAITAAMASSTGLLGFAKRFPDRFFDVGIAEQHAVTFATALAMRGLRPVVCIYSTFLQRAFDQVVCDAALHRAPVLFVIDRAGVTGEDGASHHGMLDLAYLRCVPGMTVAAPSSPSEMEQMLKAGLSADGPFAIRFPRGTPATTDSEDTHGTPSQRSKPFAVPSCRLVREGDGPCILALGKMVLVAEEASSLLEEHGIHPAVVDARFAKPLAPELLRLASRGDLTVTIEDGTLSGGFGSAVAEALAAQPGRPHLLRLGLPDQFLRHGRQDLVLEQLQLTPAGVRDAVLAALRVAAGAPAPA